MSVRLLTALFCVRAFAAADGEAMRDAVASPIPAAAASGAAFSFFRVPVSPATPITSTEWLERRGLLESLSVSEAAASQAARTRPKEAKRPALAPPAHVPSFAWRGFALLFRALASLKALLLR